MKFQVGTAGLSSYQLDDVAVRTLHDHQELVLSRDS